MPSDINTLISQLETLQNQQRQIEKQLAEARQAEKLQAVQRIRALMAEFNLTIGDLRISPKAERKTRTVPAKYRDPATGKTWSGRGIKPKWFSKALEQGKTPEELSA